MTKGRGGKHQRQWEVSARRLVQSHGMEGERTDEAACFGVERAVDRHKVGGAQELVEFHQPHPGRLGNIRGAEGVEGDGRGHAERREQLDRLLSDPAEACAVT